MFRTSADQQRTGAAQSKRKGASNLVYLNTINMAEAPRVLDKIFKSDASLDELRRERDRLMVRALNGTQFVQGTDLFQAPELPQATSPTSKNSNDDFAQKLNLISFALLRTSREPVLHTAKRKELQIWYTQIRLIWRSVRC
uniref:Uncharacterized protein n=1 Tax=Steinernema glaseri TaxID=37863 RepID=A0A1I7YHI9_9BILA